MIKEDDSVELGIKEASVRVADATAGTAVKEHDGLSVRVTTLLVAVPRRVGTDLVNEQSVQRRDVD